MDKYPYFKITGLRMAGFKCHEEPVEYWLDDLNIITGGNHTGKTTIADAIAFAITGKGYLGGHLIDKFYNENGRELLVTLTYQDDKGFYHVLNRQRKNDKMEIALDDRAIRQKDLQALFGDTDEFLSLFNPTYFIEVLQEEGRALLERHLPPIPQKIVVERLSEPMQAILNKITFLSPEAALKNLREEKRETEDALLAYSGRQELAAELAQKQKDAQKTLHEEIAGLQTQLDALEHKRTDSIDMKALDLDLMEAVDRYNELLNEKPPVFDPSPYRARQAELREKIKARWAETYESKLAAGYEKVERSMINLRARYSQTNAFLKNLAPGAVCPQCRRPVPAEDLIACETALKTALDEWKQKGSELALQKAELAAMDEKCADTFEQYKKDDLATWQRESAALTAECDREADRAVKAQEAYAHEVQQLSLRIQDIQEKLTNGNLSDAEASQLAEIKKSLESRQAVLHSMAATEEQPQTTDNTYEMMVQSLAETEEKITAVLDFAAMRNELLFDALHTEHVSCKLYEIVKQTGELRNIWQFTYKGRDYRRLSRSEKVLAGLEITELLKKLLGCCYPVFVDDSESIDDISCPSGQAILARVVRGKPLTVASKPVSRQLPQAG